ncbi:hypothetical protein [Salinibacter ruber]|nr:hypothetical protein [Salinibacter ruber]
MSPAFAVGALLNHIPSSSMETRFTFLTVESRWMTTVLFFSASMLF